MLNQYQILKYAMIGISARIERENQINEITRNERGRDNNIAKNKIARLEKDFDTVIEMMREYEKRETK